MSSPPARLLLVAHRAGNDLDLLAEAFAIRVDYAEADVWLHHGRLEVRHDKTAGPLPVLWERWELKPGWTRRLLLPEVLAAAKGRGKLFLDLKGSEPALAREVARAVEGAGMAGDVAFSTPGWQYLDELSELMPVAPRFYTIGTVERLADIRPRLARREVPAVSIHSAVLTFEVATELRQAGVGPIVSWAVETAEMARRVLAWGVGVTSKNLRLLEAIRRSELAGLD